MKNRKYIRFRNKKIIPYIFYMSINKNNKIIKTIIRKNRSRAQTSLKIKSSGAEVL